MSDDLLTPPKTSALDDRLNTWVSKALTRVRITPAGDSGLHLATLPAVKGVGGLASTEGEALDQIRYKLRAWAIERLNNGRDLPEWDKPEVNVSPEITGLVRVTRLRKLLHKRAVQWGTVRQHLPAGIVPAVLADIDAIITRHSMAIQGVA